MDGGLKQRLVGAAVLVIAGVVFIPMLLDEPVQKEDQIEGTNIPTRPDDAFASRIVPIETLEAPLADEQAPDAQIFQRPPDSLDDSTVEVVDVDELALLEPEPTETGEVESQSEGGAATNSQANTGQRLGVSAWVVQLGSFENRENALALEAKLKEQGYNAFVDSPVGRSGEVFRVRVGPELLHSEATRLREELKEKLALEAMVLRYP